MEFKVNDFIEPIEKDSVLRGRLFQIISFGEQTQSGKSLRFARIRNLETKAEVNIEEPMLLKRFRKVDFKAMDLPQTHPEKLSNISNLYDMEGIQ
jgi:hypothetical protein